MDKLTVDEVPLDLLKLHGQALFDAHYRELSVDKGRPLSPDWATLAFLDEMDRLHVIAAFEGDLLVGYAASIYVPRHLHYDFAYVQNDALFVSKSHRGTSAGGRLMGAVRTWAKERGAAEVCWHAKEGTELHRKLDRSRDRYVLRDIFYSEKV